MSNIAGKSYAMNVVTPARWYTVWWQKVIFWLVTWIKLPVVTNSLLGLQTLSLIHYARWAIIRDKQFPHLSASQPREKLSYYYMFFFSNFNGSWDQYVDSFSMAIPDGLDLFWFKNVKYPQSVPLQPFHAYITFNQIWTNHYYNAYPMAASNDIKGSQSLRDGLLKFNSNTRQGENACDFKERFNALLIEQQQNLSTMEPTPIVSLSAEAVDKRLGKEKEGETRHG